MVAVITLHAIQFILHLGEGQRVYIFHTAETIYRLGCDIRLFHWQFLFIASQRRRTCRPTVCTLLFSVPHLAHWIFKMARLSSIQMVYFQFTTQGAVHLLNANLVYIANSKSPVQMARQEPPAQLQLQTELRFFKTSPRVAYYPVHYTFQA